MVMRMMMKTKWRLYTSFIMLTALFSSATYANTTPLTSFQADYIVYRAGKSHGTAHRYLTHTEQGYELGYSSDISWMIFSDKRQETSRFIIENDNIHPLRYTMQRSGTGPNRYYELNLNPETKVVTEGKARKAKAIKWQEDWLDPISYQLQLVLDLKAGKTEFRYNVLNRSGNSKTYHYKVVAEEMLALPYGNTKTLRIVRTEQNSNKQIYAWVAPELDYMLVRLWSGEDNVEQFDVQLHKLVLTPIKQTNDTP